MFISVICELERFLLLLATFLMLYFCFVIHQGVSVPFFLRVFFMLGRLCQYNHLSKNKTKPI